MHVKNLRDSLPRIEELHVIAYFVTVLLSTKLCQMTKNRAGFYAFSVNARRDYSVGGIRWRRIAIVNGTIEIKSPVSRGLKNFQFAMVSRGAALSGSLIFFLEFFFSSQWRRRADRRMDRQTDGQTYRRGVIHKATCWNDRPYSLAQTHATIKCIVYVIIIIIIIIIYLFKQTITSTSFDIQQLNRTTRHKVH